MKREGGRRSVEDDIDVIANDLTMELSGRMESGAALGIVGGAEIAVSDVGNLSVEECSEAIDDCRGRV